MYTGQWLSTVGRAQGYTNTSFTSGTFSNTSVFGDEVPIGGKLFILPVCSIVPAFSVIGAKLLPSQMISGLRLEFTLASPEMAFATVNQGTLTSMDNYDVMDLLVIGRVLH